MDKNKRRIIKQKVWNLLTRNLNYENYTYVESKYEYWCAKDKEALWGHHFFISKKAGSNEKYCIFRNKYPYDGVFAVANQYIFEYQWAKERGYIPLMDWESVYNFKKRKIGEYNLWEICFEQPIKVKDAISKEWVLVESVGVGEKKSKKTCLVINGDENDCAIHLKKENWRQYYEIVHDYAEQCWKIKDDLVNTFQKKYGSYFGNGKKIVGVSLREEFSTEAMELRDKQEVIDIYKKHPLVPGVKDIIERVKELQKNWNCEYIFVATMCLDSIDAFKKAFGESVIFYVERERVSLQDMIKQAKWGESDEEFNEMAMEDKTANTMREYVQEIVALSKCDYLIASVCSASAAALAMNGGNYTEVDFLPDLHHIYHY